MLLAVLCLGFLLPEGSGAQELPPDPSVTQILESYDALAPGSTNSGMNLVRRFLEREPGQAELDSLVTGLARFGIEGSTFGVRRQAVLSLFLWADAVIERNPHRVVEVLEGAYNNTPDPGRKATIIQRMVEFGPRGGVVAFLRGVAITDEPASERNAAMAIEILAQLGAPGRAVLQELHAQDLVSAPLARMILDDLARRGFRGGGEA